MNSWTAACAIWALVFAFALNREVTQGYSVIGCYLRGWHGIEDGACEHEATP